MAKRKILTVDDLSDAAKDALSAAQKDPLTLLLDECVYRLMEADPKADALSAYCTALLVMGVVKEFDFDILRADLVPSGMGLLAKRKFGPRYEEIELTLYLNE